MGRIIDLLADRDGKVVAAVIEFGGFLGIGTRKIAVEWSALRIEADKSPVAILDVTREQLRVAPEYKPDRPQRYSGSISRHHPPWKRRSLSPNRCHPCQRRKTASLNNARLVPVPNREGISISRQYNSVPAGKVKVPPHGIAAPGHTRRAHDLCPPVPPDARRHLLVPDCGHFSLFHGDLFAYVRSARVAGVYGKVWRRRDSASRLSAV